MLRAEELPRQTVAGVEAAEEGAVERVFTTIVALTQVVELQTFSALTQ